MADDRQVNITIKSTYEGKGTVDAKKAVEGLEQTTKKANSNMVEGAKRSSRAIVDLAAAINVAKAAWGAARAAVAWLAESVDMANKNARAVNMLSAAYQNVGYTASGAVEQAKRFATEMQNLTGIADEAFLDAQRLLANYGVVGTKAQEAIRAAYALSVAQGMDFESALMQIAKAAVGSTAALSRYGIVLGDGVKEGEKFDAVLQQINERFGASAQATMGDAITRTNALKQQWGDFREEIGSNVSITWNMFIDNFAQGIEKLSRKFKILNNAFAYVYDLGILAFNGLKTAFYGLVYGVVKGTNDMIKSWDKFGLIPKSVHNSLQEIEEDFKKNLETSAKYTSSFNSIRTTLADILPKEKQITKENNAQLKANEDLVNSKRKNLDTAKEQAEKQKEITKELERQQQVLDNMGLSSSKDLKGWNRDKQSSEQGPSELEVAAGGSSQLGNAENAWATVEAEREAINWLYLEKKALIDQEITDEELKQEALTNLENQYNQQKLINDKNQAKARQQVYASMWSSLSSLATNENKKVAAVGKVASIAQATMSTLTGAAKALELPFPANLAAMAAVLAQGFALVGQIQSVKLADGGLVKAVTGGVPAVVGEGGSDEAVLPLDNARAMQRIGGAIAEQGGQMGPTVNVYVQTQATGGVEAILEQLTEASRNGVVQALEFANLNYKVGSQQQGYSV